MRTRFLAQRAIAVCLAIMPGCQALDIGLSPTSPQATPGDPVMEVVCLWEPAEGIGLDNRPTRGFAGQIMFFTSARPEPVQVDGHVSIYVFDDFGTPEEQGRPIHKFEFPAEVWNTYLRESNLGAAYQLFIPYTRKGGYTADCALRVCLQPENGLPLYSKLSSVHLAGRNAPVNAATQSEPELTHTAHVVTSPGARSGIDARMRNDVTDFIDQQRMSRSLQRSAAPSTADLEAAIADLLRERESQVGDSEVINVDLEVADEPLTGRYQLSAGQ